MKTQNQELYQLYCNRPQEMTRPNVKLTADQLANPALDAAERAVALTATIRSVSLRLMCYLNSPLKSIIEVPLEDALLKDAAPDLFPVIIDELTALATGRKNMAFPKPAHAKGDFNTELYARYLERPKTLFHPTMKLHPEELLNRVANTRLDPESMAKAMTIMLREASLRVVCSPNSPIKAIAADTNASILDVSFDDARMAGVAARLFPAIVAALREASEDAMLKNIALNHPGG